MRDEGMFLGERVRGAQQAVMALEQEVAAAGLDERRRRKGPRRMPAQPDQASGIREAREDRLRLGGRDRGPGGRLQRRPHAVDEMVGGRTVRSSQPHDQKAREIVATTARPLPI